MSSDSLTVVCPQCSSKLNIKEELRDKKIACPKCQFKFRLNFKKSTGDFSSIVHPELDTRDSASQSRWKLEHGSGSQSNLDNSRTGSSRRSGSGSGGISGSGSGSTTKPFSGSFSSSSPLRTDWGVEHDNQTRNFKRRHSGLSRAQIYLLARAGYRPLSDRDEILQSTGIFLVIIAVLTSFLPLFDLKIAAFSTAGSLPAILSITAAIIGMLMIVIAQRKNSIMAIGLGLGMLLMFIVAYIGIYDFFGKQNPFRSVNRSIQNDAAANDLAEGNEAENIEKKAPLVIADGNALQREKRQRQAEFADGVMAEDFNNPQPRPGNGGRQIGVAGNPRPNHSDVRQPANPRNIEIPDDFDPADDRFAPDNQGAPDNRKHPLVDETGKSSAQKNSTAEVEDQQTNKQFSLRNRVRKMTSESLLRGVPQTDEFAEEYSFDNAGKVTTMGRALMTKHPVVGFDYLDRGGVLITDIAPFNGNPEFSSSIYSPGGEKLRGLICHFRDKQLVGVQALYEMRGRDTLASGAWAGKPLPVGEVGAVIDSGGRDIYGFAVYEDGKSIVGLGVVFKKR